jgi:hypothetical protein
MDAVVSARLKLKQVTVHAKDGDGKTGLGCFSFSGFTRFPLRPSRNR